MIGHVAGNDGHITPLCARRAPTRLFLPARLKHHTVTHLNETQHAASRALMIGILLPKTSIPGLHSKIQDQEWRGEWHTDLNERGHHFLLFSALTLAHRNFAALEILALPAADSMRFLT